MTICIEGIDRVGKDLLKNYLIQLTNHRHTIISRGLISGIVYSKIANRSFDYSLDEWRNVLFVYLTCEKDDLTIRCKISNEPRRDFAKDSIYFEDVASKLKNCGVRVETFNTSLETPYSIALQVIEMAEDIVATRKDNNEEQS